MTQARNLTQIQPHLLPDPAFYAEARRRAETADVQQTIDIPAFTGRGFRVPRGSAFRVIQVDKPQVADVALWSAENPSEYFSATRTWVLEGWFLKAGRRLWSDIPRLRPMATCIADTVVSTDPDYHHHFVGTHCTPEWLELRSGIPGLNACHVNLLEGMAPLGLRELDLHDNFMVHQKVRIDPETGRLDGARSDGAPGDYVEFFAEIDLLVAIGLCPNGDNTHYWSTPEDGVVSPLQVEVRDLGMEPQEFPVWQDWRLEWKGSWLASQRDASAAEDATSVE